MDIVDVLSCSMQANLDKAMQGIDAKPSPEVCIMHGEASAEIGDEMTSNNAIPWPMNHEVKQENDCVSKAPGLYHWFESQALSEAVSSVNIDQADSNSASLQDLMEASRLNKNKDLLQLLDEIGLDSDASTMVGQYWQEGGNELNNQNTDCYSMSSTDDSQQYSDCQPLKSYFEQLPVISSFPGTVGNCSPVQTRDGSIWPGQSTANTARGVTVECLQTGQTVPIEHCSTSVVFPSTSQQPRDLNDELKKQEEKKRKRRERNKQCSREFRRKQKVREQLLGRGKGEKEQILMDRQMRVEKTTKILLKIATSSGACEKGRSIINMVAGLINKENWPCGIVKGNVAPKMNVSHNNMQT